MVRNIIIRLDKAAYPQKQQKAKKKRKQDAV
jgi:hypothetical protein